MAARAAIHLRGKYEVGDMLGEGAVQKATSHRAVHGVSPEFHGIGVVGIKRPKDINCAH